jgi:hypothetical protein
VAECLVLHPPPALIQLGVGQLGDLSEAAGVGVEQGPPQATTVSFTVCQSQPKSDATSFELRAFKPTWTVAHRPVLPRPRGR